MKKLKHCIISCFMLFAFFSCEKNKEIEVVPPSNNLSIDSIVASKKSLVVWEETYITVYTTGKDVTVKWATNHGSMLSMDSTTVKYWGCPSCVGNNVVECMATNSFGTIIDTIMINVVQTNETNR